MLFRRRAIFVIYLYNMRKNVLIAIIMIIISLASCAKKTDDRAQSIDSKALKLIQLMPSDALGLIYSDECSEAMSKVDSTSPLRKLEFGSLASAKTAISFCYQGSIVPVLAIDAGRKANDSTEAISSLMLQAGKAKLHSHFVRDDKEGRGTLIIAGSESLMNAVKRHITEGSSILEAEGFREALDVCADADDFIIVKNSGISRFLPAQIFGGAFSKREISNFANTLALWTCVRPQKDGSAQIKTYNETTDIYFSQLIAGLPDNRSRATAIIPDTCSFAISSTIDRKMFRDAYERYLDANVMLSSYERNLKSLKENTKKDPLKWEQELGIDEVVLLHWQGYALQLVHSAVRQDNRECSDNKYPNFIPALYGTAFRIEDDSQHAVHDNWHIFGSKESVNAFIAYCATRDTKHKKTAVKRHFMVRHDEWTLEWNEKEISLWNSNL